MGISYNNGSIARNGLVLHVDSANPKSWKGAPTINHSPNVFGGNADVHVSTVQDILPNGKPGTVHECTAVLTAAVNRTCWLGASSLSLAGGTYQVSYYVKNINCTGFAGNVYDITAAAVLVAYNYTSQVVVGEWRRISYQFTVAADANPFHSIMFQCFRDGGVGTWRATWPQVELGAVTTPYVLGTRANTQSMVDMSGSGTITVNNLVPAADGSFSFNGVNSYINCGNDPALQISSAITMEAWVNPSSVATLGNIISKNGNGGFRFRVEGDNSLWFYVSGNWCKSAGTLVPNNTWSHVTVVGDSSGLRGYVNGVQVSSNSTPFAPTAPATGDVYIGCYLINQEVFNGRIDVAKVYNRALSIEEIQQNFEAHRARYGV